MIIRNGKKEDLREVLCLIRELAEYENALSEVEITLQELENDGFGEKPYFGFLVAEKNSTIIGLSFYWIRYSTWKGKFLFLEDFIVKKEYRRNDIGSKLFYETLRVCEKMKCKGMCWQVLDWNKPAINFYKKYNARISSEWLNGKLTEVQIKNILK
jgi:GNAT superfamily N-acetyltransferase|tara:strand:- start:105340 stop:105807 length:468 start_codon:yes stop_codon:yes gene_type:complete